MKKIASRKDSRVIDLLIAHGAAGYGVYVLLVEYLGERKAYRLKSDYKRIAYEFHADAEVVRSVLEDFGLFDCTDTEYYNLGKAPRPAEESDGLPKETPKASPVETAVDPVGKQELAAPYSAPPMTRSERRRLERLQRKRHPAA